MPAVKLTKFLGIAPKIGPELLPNSAAQIATNVKLHSGDLIPYRQPLTIALPLRSGIVKTVYPMQDPADATSNLWLSWVSDVDIVRPTSLSGEEQRIYYTGDGAPKVTDYALAIQGAGSYPYASYDLGLPLPATVPTVSAASFASTTTVSYARDSGNIATIVTGTPHGLRSDLVVSITSFVSATGLTFNGTNVRVTVLNATSFSYYNQGAVVAVTGDTNGSVSLAGTPANRTYVYSWLTPWGEESVPSNPTTEIYVREGQTVTISGLPTAPPAGSNFVRGFRVYRTVPSSVATTYYLLAEIWFPNPLVSASRASNIVTMTTLYPHNLLVADQIKITSTAFGGVPDTSFDVTDVAVLSVVDKYKFTYTAAGSDKATTVTSAGYQYWDTAEPGVTSSRFYTGSSFIDDFLVTHLSITIDSLYNEAPDENMTGLIVAQNNILVGFVGNELCFSEIDKPWAWPNKYRLVFPHTIVGLASIAGAILVLTDSYPYLVSGSSPEAMAYARIDAPYPCESKRGIVNLGYGVIYPTHGGLAIYSPSSGIDIVTKQIYDWDTWNEIDQTTIVAAFSANKYFASHAGGAFIFERDEKSGGYFVDISVKFDAAYYDTIFDKFFFIDNATKELREWDPLDQPAMSFEWKSKVIITEGYTNIGAARVFADYAGLLSDLTAIQTYNAAAVAYNISIRAITNQFGCLNGPAGFTNSTGAKVYTPGGFNSIGFNRGAASLARLPLAIDSIKSLTFRMWAKKEEVIATTLTSDATFRLPAGYKTDTFEISVSGNTRAKAIHFGETPTSLREA